MGCSRPAASRAMHGKAGIVQDAQGNPAICCVQHWLQAPWSPCGDPWAPFLACIPTGHVRQQADGCEHARRWFILIAFKPLCQLL